MEKLKNSRLQFNSSGDVVYGKHAQKRFDELAIFGAHDYSELEYGKSLKCCRIKESYCNKDLNKKSRKIQKVFL